MDRRAFLGGSLTAGAFAGVAVAASVASTPVLKPGGRRFSCREGDPGERNYAIACGDGLTAVVYLDGVKQKYAITADEAEGSVLRIVETPNGNAAYNKVAGKMFEETVYGDVRVELVPKKG